MQKNPLPPSLKPAPGAEKAPPLTRFEKLMYGIGSGGFQMATDGVKQLAYPIYNITLGLSPSLIAFVLMVSRLFDAFTDPMMGKISDDTRSRWGRRRPYIFGGAFLVSIAFVLIWRVNPDWGDQAIFYYYMGTMLLFFLCSTIQVVPYHTLGLEMTADYNERTVISAYKMAFSFLFVIIIPWVFRLAQAERFGTTMEGIKFLSYFLGLAIVIGGVLPALFVKERYYRVASQQRKIPFLVSAKLVFKNRSFLNLTGIILLAGTCVGMVNFLGLYIVIYYMYEGDTKDGSSMFAILSNASTILAFFSVFFVTWLSNRLGKVRTLKLLISWAIVGEFMKLVLYNQSFPWLVPFMCLWTAPNTAGFWTITTSMKADICDEDELEHGMRREGMFGSVGNWVLKVAMSISLLLSGVILDLTGFNVELGADQNPTSLLLMRILFTAVPAIFFALTLLLLSKYKLSRERMEEIRTELEARRQEV